MAEADRIISEMKAFILERNNANNELLGGRTKINQIGAAAADYVARTGFNRSVIELNAEAAGRHAANAIKAQTDELKKTLAEIKKAGSLTDAQIKALEQKTHSAALLGSEQGAKDGVLAGMNEVSATWTAALRETLGHVLEDFGKGFKKEDIDEVVSLVLQNISESIAPDAGIKVSTGAH